MLARFDFNDFQGIKSMIPFILDFVDGGKTSGANFLELFKLLMVVLNKEGGTERAMAFLKSKPSIWYNQINYLL